MAARPLPVRPIWAGGQPSGRRWGGGRNTTAMGCLKVAPGVRRWLKSNLRRQRDPARPSAKTSPTQLPARGPAPIVSLIAFEAHVNLEPLAALPQTPNRSATPEMALPLRSAPCCRDLPCQDHLAMSRTTLEPSAVTVAAAAAAGLLDPHRLSWGEAAGPAKSEVNGRVVRRLHSSVPPPASGALAVSLAKRSLL